MNRLSGETSPYLRQHAANPVEWYPWGEPALERARAEDKPLFISVGYAACHWCHVMAHESFEDEEVAALLADSFISIKVDREERPDLDAIYMAAVLAQNGSGGWPMSVFCTPDGRPFFAGTYYPKADRGGYPGFRRVVGALAEAWTDQRDAVERQANELLAAVEQQVTLENELTPASSSGPPSFDAPLDALIVHLATTFDATWGGWGTAPKFPRPTLVELCLRQHARTGDEASLAMATATLDAMAAGGIYDHLAGGFARYSTDRQWLVPHFEKMLTDQALLARAYLHAWMVTGRADYLQVTTETLDAMLRDLKAPNGGLCSSIDADARGHEGAHATFTTAEVRHALGAAGLGEFTDLVCAFYGVTERGNWEATNVLRRPLGAPLARSAEMEAARVALFQARLDRIQPGIDDKVLTEWNAMAVSTLAEAAGAAGVERWALAAQEIAEVLFSRLRRDDGRWLRSLQGDDARHLALSADYAWVVDASTRLGELTGERALDRARHRRGRLDARVVLAGVGRRCAVHDRERRDAAHRATPRPDGRCGPLRERGRSAGAPPPRRAERRGGVRRRGRAHRHRRLGARRTQPGRIRRHGRGVGARAGAHRGRRGRRPSGPARGRPVALAPRGRPRMG